MYSRIRKSIPFDQMTKNVYFGENSQLRWMGSTQSRSVPLISCDAHTVNESSGRPAAIHAFQVQVKSLGGPIGALWNHLAALHSALR